MVCHTKQKRRKATLVFFVACLRRFFGVLFFTCSYASMSYLVDAKLNSRHYLNKSPILTSNHFFDLFISRLYLLILTMLQYYSKVNSLMSNRLIKGILSLLTISKHVYEIMFTKVPIYVDSFIVAHIVTYNFHQKNTFLLSLLMVHKNDLTTISINQNNFFFDLQ